MKIFTETKSNCEIDFNEIEYKGILKERYKGFSETEIQKRNMNFINTKHH